MMRGTWHGPAGGGLPATAVPGVCLAAVVVVALCAAAAEAQVVIVGEPVRATSATETLGGGGPAAKGLAYPTAYEQYLVELINRGRADPPAEAARYGIALNEGPPSQFISDDPKQPLAVNPNLMDAARGHSQWMIDADTFDHYSPATPGQRMAAAGYVFVAPWGWGENIAISLAWPNPPPMPQTVDDLHEGLFVDTDIDGRGHRVNLMYPAYKELGSGIATGIFTDPPDNWQAVTVTEDFAYTAGNSFITGVAFDDVVTADDFYTPGEGLGGVTITATRDGGGVYTTTTWAAGGYSLRVPPGTYDVTASGGGLGGTAVISDVSVGTLNVKCDFTPDMVLGPLDVEAALDHNWVYQNTLATTQDRHKSTLTITLVTEALPGEPYTITVGENGGPLANFTTAATGNPLVIDVVGGRIGASTASAPASRTLNVTVTGDTSGQSDSADVALQLRLIGDMTGDGFVAALDKAHMNAWLNAMPLPGDTVRHCDLTGDGFVNAVDKVQINRQLNGLGIL